MKPLTISALESGAGERMAAVDAFLDQHTMPITEGDFCTFAWRGEADAVRLRHWIYGLESTQTFQRLEGTDFWSLVMQMPRESRFEYKIEIERDGNRQLIQDPLNPLLAYDPFGANSVCHTTGYQTPAWTQTDPQVREGSLDEFPLRSRAFGDIRKITVYAPQRFRPTSRYRLLVVHDGHDYLRFSGLKTVLDNLIHRYEVGNVVVALTDSPNRLEEYAASERHAAFMHDELLPAMEDRYPLIGTPESRCLMGASLGAVASLHTATQYPATFGNLVLQSGSFAFSDIGEHERGPLFDNIASFINDYRTDPHAVAQRVFVSCGTYESLIYENRSLVPVLQNAGMDVRYVEARDGHNWENWRDRLREGLSWIYPGPLWMVYD